MLGTDSTIDQVQLNFSEDSLWLLNLCLGFIMFGVALELKPAHFKEFLKDPKPVLVGLFSQFLLLPALTFLICWWIKPHPSMALGLMLVAACPGGNVSNFISLQANGNAALSVALTAISTSISVFMTPLNFTFWGGLYEPGAELLTTIDINGFKIFKSVLTLLGIPLVIGMLTAHFKPNFTKTISKGVRFTSILIFAAFVIIAFTKNTDIFLQYIGIIVALVLLHNALALTSGYSIARLFRLSSSNRRTIAIETGIQNSGLGLVIVFNFFDGLGGMAIVAGWWGIWHILSGMALATYWSKFKPLS